MSGQLRLPADITTLFRAASPSPLGGRGRRLGSGSVCTSGLRKRKMLDGTPHSPLMRPPYPWAPRLVRRERVLQSTQTPLRVRVRVTVTPFGHHVCVVPVFEESCQCVNARSLGNGEKGESRVYSITHCSTAHCLKQSELCVCLVSHSVFLCSPTRLATLTYYLRSVKDSQFG